MRLTLHYALPIAVRPWADLSCETVADGRITIMRDAGNVTVHVAAPRGMQVVEHSQAWLLLEVIHAAPDVERRHAAGANAARRRAGELAMQLANVEARAAVMDTLDLWSAVFPDGQDYARPEWLDGQAIVRLVCNSTGRVYAHIVPGDCQNAEQARAWIMRALAPAWAARLPIGKVST